MRRSQEKTERTRRSQKDPGGARRALDEEKAEETRRSHGEGEAFLASRSPGKASHMPATVFFEFYCKKTLKTTVIKSKKHPYETQ